MKESIPISQTTIAKNIYYCLAFEDKAITTIDMLMRAIPSEKKNIRLLTISEDEFLCENVKKILDTNCIELPCIVFVDEEGVASIKLIL